MSMIKRNGNSSYAFPALFDEFFNRDIFNNWGLLNNSATGTTIPSVNIKETPECFEVEMAAPGMKKDDFKIELDGNTLSITSQKQDEYEQREDERYTRKEFGYQSFQRTFTLPKNVVDTDQIKAKYENGVLELVIPKREEARQKPPRMISIA